VRADVVKEAVGGFLGVGDALIEGEIVLFDGVGDDEVVKFSGELLFNDHPQLLLD
jgi:hypothetical protein